MPPSGGVLTRSRIASTAAPSAAFLSPRPIHLPAASAAASVPRTNSIARLRSGAWALSSMTPPEWGAGSVPGPDSALHRARLAALEASLLDAARAAIGFMPDDEGLAL